ncbi:hypothetical protein GLOIN_2v1846829 [Rhizophagus irregularis DAOM 181602=DAOM 197198]|nr:hypothetical protein GLOIN_2v1846829 [Rhizophagus irregularis DAOM 181602=DAOM 197198]
MQSNRYYSYRTDKPRSLTPPPLPPKPVALMGGLERYPMRRSASAPEISAYRFERSHVLIDAEEYFNSVWEAVRNDGTPDDKKFLDIVPRGKTYHFINGKLIESNYVSNQFYVENRHNIYFATTWAEAKRNQLYGRLCTVVYLATFRVLYQQGYVIIRDTTWYNMLKWLQNPEFYLIDKKYNFENIIRISDCGKYRGKSVEIERICNSLPLKFLYYSYINKKDVTINFSDLDDNCELVRRIFQISP